MRYVCVGVVWLAYGVVLDTQVFACLPACWLGQYEITGDGVCVCGQVVVVCLELPYICVHMYLCT